MNINLVYEGKEYNFDIPNGVTIDYIKELSSKIFNSDKSLLDLVYNNEKFTHKDDKTLVRDLVPEGETNIILTVQINNNINNSIKNINLKKSDIKDKVIKDYNFIYKNNFNKNKKVSINDNTLLNKKNKKSISAESILNKEKKNDLKPILNKNESKIFNNNKKDINHIQNEFDIMKNFDTIYFKKNNILLSLLKEFNEKIKEIYLHLYKKSKNISKNNEPLSPFSSSNTSRSSLKELYNNNYIYELFIFEKKLIDFKESQIQYYSKLLNILKKDDNNGVIFKLNELFNNLILYNFNSHNNTNNNINNKDKHLELIQPLKKKNKHSFKLINSNSSKSHNLTSLNAINNKFPILKNKVKHNNSIVKENKISNNININEKSKDEENSSKNKIINKKLVDSQEEKGKKENDSNFIKRTTTIDEKLNMKIDNNNNKNKINKISRIKTNNFNNLIYKINNKLFNKIKNEMKDNNNNNNINDISNKGNNKTINKNNDEDTSNKSLKKIINNNNNLSPIHLNKNKYKNNYFSDNNLINNIYNNDKIKEEKIKKKYYRYNSLNNLNKFKFLSFHDKNASSGEIMNRDFKNNEITNDNLVLKDEELFLSRKNKIKEINVSSITVNSSNFFRDKQIFSKKKKRKSISKFDFMI